MQISKPCALNEIGKRQNNEDNIYPQINTATEKQHFFVVCDGMGGHENGEVASDTVCQSFASQLQNINPEVFTPELFKNALDFAFSELDKKDKGESSRKMGTTLTFLHLNNQQAFMAHIGDSRIYHLRKNETGKVEILYKSQDHSLVNELVQSGIITEEEAANHPKKNVITRAMQPKMEKPPKADTHITQNVKAGDRFFLCTDGVLETITDEQLCTTISQNNTDEKIMQAVYNLCNEHSRDNFSAYLISVTEGITLSTVESIPMIEEAKEAEVEISMQSQATDPPKKPENVQPSKMPQKAIKKKSRSRNLLLFLILLVLIAIFVFLVVNKVTFKQIIDPLVNPPKTEQPAPESKSSDNSSEKLTATVSYLYHRFVRY